MLLVTVHHDVTMMLLVTSHRAVSIMLLPPCYYHHTVTIMLLVTGDHDATMILLLTGHHVSVMLLLTGHHTVTMVPTGCQIGGIMSPRCYQEAIRSLRRGHHANNVTPLPSCCHTGDDNYTRVTVMTLSCHHVVTEKLSRHYQHRTPNILSWHYGDNQHIATNMSRLVTSYTTRRYVQIVNDTSNRYNQAAAPNISSCSYRHTFTNTHSHWFYSNSISHHPPFFHI